MLKNKLQKLINFFRRLLGVHLILRSQRELQIMVAKQRKELGEQRQLLLKSISLLQYSLIDVGQVKNSITYQKCLEIVSLLSPMDVMEGKFVRIGKDFDGGYVMLDIFQNINISAAYSFGIGSDVSWDESIAKLGINVFMYDHTIDGLPKLNPMFNFFEIGVTGNEKGQKLKTLEELIHINNHTNCADLIMKMDIEGCEWDVFNATSMDVINQFSQIVIEFHGLVSRMQDPKYSLIVDVLKKLNQTHQVVHVHANAGSIPLWIGEFVLPNLLEVTYIRRVDYKNKFVPTTRQFPTEIDQPTFAGLPDIFLGHFSPK